jgi:hypothetical protein
MSSALVLPAAGLFAASASGEDVGRATPERPVQGSGSSLPDPFAGEPKWAAWKVTLFVILFCGAFWAGVAWLVLRLFA